MIGLDRILALDGVLAAGQFAEDGSMVRGVGKLDEAEMKEVARLCKKAAERLAETVKELDTATSLPWGQLNGWVVMGNNLALCVADEAGVIVDTRRVDFNEILVALFGPPAGEVPVP